ncbi:glycoside hydrolase family 19 protein [Ralstonia mojiangensis]|uniref:glycoside hydrolase family 19 protein n=1 Tax=Ralstonia mojiangensis TaxID=2953895 RepID=UPI002091322E|nr:glycoside hydrolase family 19 protein [Ralstonia mojiangensis]MCO5413698.1 glycoside hydrolase family 19 protein [Ralstonia mojiangensis]
MAEPLLTAAQLRAVMPSAGGRADVFAPILADVLLFRQINTTARIAAFLAQVGHESGQLRYVRELWGPTLAQRGYEGRADLGNTQPGDGKRFLGRGLIQITGRANYRACGIALGLDLEAQPELLETPAHATASAAWFWLNNGLNRFADQDSDAAFVQLTRRVNGGTNGLDDRRALWLRARAVLTGGAPS